MSTRILAFIISGSRRPKDMWRRHVLRSVYKNLPIDNGTPCKKALQRGGTQATSSDISLIINENCNTYSDLLFITVVFLFGRSAGIMAGLNYL